MTNSEALIGRLWHEVAAGRPYDAGAVQLSGPERVLPSVFDVTALASAAVAVATLAAADVLAARSGAPLAPVSVDRRAAAAAFVCEALFEPSGWELPAPWDPIAGDYAAADGWIRLHTNYRHHRAAVERVLGAGGDRDAVAAQVRHWAAVDLETAVVDAGGCAAAMHDRAHWLASAAGAAGAREPAVRVDSRAATAPPELAGTPPGGRPFAGVRVLDLTRVIAGPVGTRFLAAHGADVLRVDPPGFQEVPALVPETSVGKHCTALDLTDPADRAVFESLVRGAHVLVGGLRADALAGLGYDLATLRGLNPALITASLDAYGWDGPWQNRRGFDSLVQMSCGIAAAGAAAKGTDRPAPLPAQALDHATGYLVAAAVGSALSRLVTDGRASDIRCSLVGTANVLMDQAVPGGLEAEPPTWTTRDTEPAVTEWGPARRVPIPGTIRGVATSLAVPAGPFGRHPASWTPPHA